MYRHMRVSLFNKTLIPLGNKKVSKQAFKNLFRNNMDSKCDSVLLEERGNKGIITLNRPSALNSLNLEMIRRIYPKLKEWESNKSLVIIKGAGEKAFCAGGDVVAITQDIKNGGKLAAEFFREEYKLNCLIGTYHIPYIAFISGITMGGGVGLSVHGQFRIATAKSLFAMPETAIGLFPDVGGSYFLSRLGGNLGYYLALTGHRLKGHDLLRAGIATHMCDHSKLADLEQSLLSIDTPYQEDIYKVMQKFSDSSKYDKNYEFSLKHLMPDINKCFQGETIEKILSNLKENGSDWAQKQISIMNKCSPTSLKVTLEELRKGEFLTLQDCLVMEYRISRRCISGNDFVEGVRALLIDKDNSPKWKPSNLSETTDELIAEYFSPLPDNGDLKF